MVLDPSIGGGLGLGGRLLPPSTLGLWSYRPVMGALREK